MAKKELKAFSISKYTYHEALMASQLQSAGAQQSRLLEKYKKKNKSIRNQAFGMKIGFGVGLAILPIIPFLGYMQLFDTINTTSIARESIFFISNFVMGIYFLMSLLYILMAGLFPTGSLMTGDAFKILQVLPIKRDDLKKIAVMSLFRSVDIALILMTFGFSIVLLIISLSILAFILCLFLSILNSLFGFCIVIVLGRKISQVFSNEAKSGKRANLIRLGTMIGYMILVFGTSMMINGAILLLDYFFEIFLVNNPPMILNIILSLIPLPITQGYIISLAIYTDYFSFELLISSLVGISLFALIVWGIYKGSIKSLQEVTMTEIKISKKKSAIPKKIEDIKVDITPKTPVKSYLHKDIVSASHDMQTLIFILIPIIYPIIMIISLQGLITEMNANPLLGIIMWIVILGILLFSPIMLVVGLLNMEESGSSIIASLPVIPRDQARAKLLLMMGIMAVTLLILSIIVMIATVSIMMFFLVVCSIPIALSFLFMAFEMKVYLFGKLKYKYILEELHKENKILKWILIILGEIGLYFLVISLGVTLFFYFEIMGTIIIVLIVGGTGLLILSFIFTRMFPKSEKMKNYETGGFLREHPIVANVILPLMYLLFLSFTIIIEILLFPVFLFLLSVNVAAAFILEFMIQFSLLALLWFLVIPFGLKLPFPQKKFKEYLKNIRFSTVSPVGRNIIIGLLTFGIFSVVVVFGGILLGDYIFDLNIILGNPTLDNYGWMLFIIMLIPGIWEEVAFRGVMLPMLLKKYHQNKALTFNSIAFGLTHLSNMLLILILGGGIAVGVIFQVIYASLLGYAFGYIYLKTKSLLPGIILHYLIDSMGQLFLNIYFTNFISAGIFLILFLGIIPSILICVFIHFFVKNEIGIEIINSFF